MKFWSGYHSVFWKKHKRTYKAKNVIERKKYEGFLHILAVSKFYQSRAMSLHVFKIVLFVTLATFFSSVTSAQSYSGIMNIKTVGDWSLEANGGLLVPFSPTNNVDAGKAYDLALGLRYLPQNSNFGVRAIYDYGSFKEDTEVKGNTTEGGLKMHRFELQGLYILNNLLNFSRTTPVELESYLGVGGILGRSKTKSSTNKIGSVSIGLRPRFDLLPKVKWFFDLAYRMQFNQKFNYAGVPHSGSDSGSLLQLGVGVSYNL